MQYKDYPYLKTLTALDILEKHNMYDEEFGIPFTFMLEKFIDECEITDVDKMKVAKKLLKVINEG